MAPLPRELLERPPPAVARDLLGREVRVSPEEAQGEPRALRVVETEAYLGPEDPGSHARRGRDTQAGALWERPGRAYVYICYGVHQMLNVVAHEPGGVGAVLFRAGEPVSGLEAMRSARGGVGAQRVASGPGNLAEALGVTREAHDGTDLAEPGGLHLAEGDPPPAERVAVSGRIGLSQGGDRLLRFADAGSPCLSRPVKSAARPDS